MENYIDLIDRLKISKRIQTLRNSMLKENRYASIEQAKIITLSTSKMKKSLSQSKELLALRESLKQMAIRIDKGELIVGNRTAGVRGGVIFS